MSDLFSLMVGLCSVYWCSFTPDPDKEIMQIRVNDTQANMVQVFNIPYADLYLEGINKCN